MILIATESRVFLADPEAATVRAIQGIEGSRPTCVAAGRASQGFAWCGTQRGMFRSEDGGVSWSPSGLNDQHVMAVATSPSDPELVWVGTEPSVLWRSEDGGRTWSAERGLLELPSSEEWAFPPKPSTHHVRWIAVHPQRPRRLWLAIEAGALITTPDGGRSWFDRVEGGPWDTHELAIHPDRPDTFRVAAGDGYFESEDGGATWRTPETGLEVGYLRSVAIDPGDADVVVVSAASGPRTAYVAGRSDGRLYRRAVRRSPPNSDEDRWTRVTHGWPKTPGTIAPLLIAGDTPGELWAADERGLHRSGDGGRRWDQIVELSVRPHHLRGIASYRP